MDLEELINTLKVIADMETGRPEVVVYCDVIKDYIPLEEVAFIPANEDGGLSHVRIG